MILKNLLRRKGRTLLTVFGIGIGVMTIIALGALANGLKAGYSAVLGGTKADFVITDPNSADIILNSIDESVATDVAAMPEVEAVSPMLQGLVRTDKNPYFFVFAYPQGAFPLERFHVVQGVDLY